MVVDFPLLLSAQYDDSNQIDIILPVDVADDDHVDVSLFFTHDCCVVEGRFRCIGG